MPRIEQKNLPPSLFYSIVFRGSGSTAAYYIGILDTDVQPALKTCRIVTKKKKKLLSRYRYNEFGAANSFPWRCRVEQHSQAPSFFLRL